MGHQNKLTEIYKNADLLVHTSIFEGLPNVIVEAIAMEFLSLHQIVMEEQKKY